MIRMDVGYLTQWGATWPRERVCGRGGIRKHCGNPWDKVWDKVKDGITRDLVVTRRGDGKSQRQQP